MMCARLLRQQPQTPFYREGERLFERLRAGYGRSLGWALAHPRLVMLALAATVGLNFYLYYAIPKGFFPAQDTGRMMGFIRADQTTSFQSMQEKMSQFVDLVRADPAIDSVTAVAGGSFGARNSGFMFISLKPLEEREPVGAVIARLRPQLTRIAGASLFLVPVSDVRVGGRQGSGTYQYTLQSDDLEALRTWAVRLEAALQSAPEVADVSSDQETRGLQASLTIDRASAARLGITPEIIDTTLGNAFGQSVVSTIYTERNQYRVVMEVDPRYAQGPEALKDVYLFSAAGERVPLAEISRYEYTNTPLSVNHQGQFAAATLSFNLAEGVSLSQADAALNETMARIGVPATVYGAFQGTARSFQTTLARQPWLILAAILAMYIVLGVLYESMAHPLTILSTLPSAGVGALLALLAFRQEFTVIALIGVFLLIGLVKKNAILMVDFALAAERAGRLAPEQAILQACLLRLRPILMTTMAALLGALPLVLRHGDGAELRQPLGIAIVGGLILSQLLTLYTPPVVYLYVDRLRLWSRRRRVAEQP
jgi:multidrug efflux pump